MMGLESRKWGVLTERQFECFGTLYNSKLSPHHQIMMCKYLLVYLIMMMMLHMFSGLNGSYNLSVSIEKR